MLLSNRHRLFKAAFSAVSLTGADRWLAPVARGRGIILTFHHVRPTSPTDYDPNGLLSVTPEFLDRTLMLLKMRGFDLVSLDDVPSRLEQPSDENPFAVLTFDDGYRDNLEFAAPVLARHRAPWTLFVTSDFADGRGRLWWIELERAIARLDCVRLAGNGRNAITIDLPARNSAEKSAAFQTAYRTLRCGSETRLLAHIASLCEEAEIEPDQIARELCLSWTELHTLATDPRVTIGAHTLSHPMLAKHSTEFARREIGESRARISFRLNCEVRHLSFPVGDPTSAGPREFDMAQDLGFTTAVTTRPGHLFSEHVGHLHALPRVSMNGLYQTDAALSSLISGVPLMAWNRGRRLNVT